MSSRISRPSLALAVIAGAALLVGCTSSSDRRASQIRGDLTPELKTLGKRPDDVKNSLAIYFNEMERMMYQDLGRAFYTDRPSRLTPEPIPR